MTLGMVMQCVLQRGAFTSAFSAFRMPNTIRSASTIATKRDTRIMFGTTTSSTKTARTQLSLSASSSSEVEEELEAYINKNNLDDQIVSAISGNGEIKVTACTIRNLVNDAMMQHTLTATPADALSRSMSCGLLIANGMQKEQTFQLTLNCDGPIRNVVTVANGEGGVKGYVGNPGLGDMHISEAIGKGSVQVVKMHPDWNNPYNGITAIEHSDVDRDVGIYLAESEQRACALAASSKFNGILCTAAGGYIVEQLPGCTSETASIVEENLGKLVEMNGGEALPAGLLMDGGTPLDICKTVLEGLDIQPLQQMKPHLFCECSAERLFRAMRLLPREEIDSILEEQEQIEARCHFCGKVYHMSPEEVEERFTKATGDPALDSDFKNNA